MIIVYRNFFRNKMVNLSLKSVRKFLPDVKVVCVSFFKEDTIEYDDQEPLDPSIEVHYFKTAFVSNNSVQDDIDSTKTSGYQNADNGKYFVEGYNAIHSFLKHLDEKVLMLSEDHFFTTGDTLKELQSKDFDLAYAPWDHDHDANGSIVCVNFANLSHVFPIPIVGMPIERLLQNYLVSKVSPDRALKMSYRRHIDYHGDGIYTNSSEVMRTEMEKAGIL